MKYAFITAHEKEFSVERMCRVLGVRRSGYYAWRKRMPSAREQANAELLVKIRDAFEKNRGLYGSRRIRHYLLRQGSSYSRQRVARLMKIAHLRARRSAKWHPQTTRQQSGARTAPNLLNQEFHAAAPNEKWVSDITYIATREGWLYLASILDLYSRRIVGWAMEETMDVSLVEKAWEMALLNRHPLPQLLHHSDRGSQYTSGAYWHLLELTQCQVSMSRTGNCYDNAAMESFHDILERRVCRPPL